MNNKFRYIQNEKLSKIEKKYVDTDKDYKRKLKLYAKHFTDTIPIRNSSETTASLEDIKNAEWARTLYKARKQNINIALQITLYIVVPLLLSALSLKWNIAFGICATITCALLSFGIYCNKTNSNEVLEVLPIALGIIGFVILILMGFLDERTRKIIPTKFSYVNKGDVAAVFIEDKVYKAPMLNDSCKVLLIQKWSLFHDHIGDDYYVVQSSDTILLK